MSERIVSVCHDYEVTRAQLGADSKPKDPRNTNQVDGTPRVYEAQTWVCLACGNYCKVKSIQVKDPGDF